MDEPRSVAALRAVLLKLGFSDDEVDRFLEQLAADLIHGEPHEETIRRTCEEFLDLLPDADDRFGRRDTIVWRMTKIIGGGVSLGVLGNFVYDLIRAGFADRAPVQLVPPEDLVFPGGWTPVKMVRREPESNSEVLCRIVGLDEVRRRIHLTVNRMAAACSVSRETYLTAESGLPLPSPVVEKITATVAVLAQKGGVAVWYTEVRRANRGLPGADPDELTLICP